MYCNYRNSVRNFDDMSAAARLYKKAHNIIKINDVAEFWEYASRIDEN